MTTRAEHIASLISKMLTRQLSAQEQAELDAWRRVSERHEQLIEEVTNGEKLSQSLQRNLLLNKNRVRAELSKQFDQIPFSINTAREKEYAAVVHRVHFLRTAWFRVAVAVLIILTGVLVYTSYFHTSDAGKEMAKGPSPQRDILPGGNKAVLTLADGSQILLDSAAAGKLAQQSGATIRKSTNGEIIYAFDKTTVTGPVVYNTMSTPRGGQYQLILPDGSKVWLNAESSVTFPTTFTGNTREIKMTGEVYFEIKTGKSKPFIVKTGSDEIQVLGTSFNVNAYNDAPVKTSLLEGSVKIKSSILKPGTAFIDGKIITTNLEQDMAWKNGEFNFSGLNVKQAMMQIGRWYDVDIRFEANVETVKLSGILTRNIPLNDLLAGLEGMGGLHFTVQKNMVTVSR